MKRLRRLVRRASCLQGETYSTGEGRALQKDVVMKTLNAKKNIPQEIVDAVYAHYGEECLESVEKFFEYKERYEKQMNFTQQRDRETDVNSSCKDKQLERSTFLAVSLKKSKGGQPVEEPSDVVLMEKTEQKNIPTNDKDTLDYHKDKQLEKPNEAILMELTEQNIVPRKYNDTLDDQNGKQLDGQKEVILMDMTQQNNVPRNLDEHKGKQLEVPKEIVLMEKTEQNNLPRNNSDTLDNHKGNKLKEPRAVVVNGLTKGNNILKQDNEELIAESDKELEEPNKAVEIKYPKQDRIDLDVHLGKQLEVPNEVVLMEKTEQNDLPRNDSDTLDNHKGNESNEPQSEVVNGQTKGNKELIVESGKQPEVPKKEVFKEMTEGNNVSVKDDDSLNAHSCKELEEPQKVVIKEPTEGNNIPETGIDVLDDILEKQLIKEVLGSDECDEKNWNNIEIGAEIKAHLLKNGLNGIKDILRRNLDEWKTKPLNIAVIGTAGKGKSSLINALRFLEDGDEGAAQVGENECTSYCRPFPHPQYETFVLWDVPGVGTQAVPKENYFDKIVVDRYDFFLVLFSDRVLIDDVWLAREIKLRKKRFYFVRTKIDNDMNSRKKRFKEHFEEKAQLEDLKKSTRNKLAEDFGSNEFHLFLISNFHPEKYDFPCLLHQLLIDVPNEKKNLMVFGIKGMSTTIINEKASALRKRIRVCALLSGAAASIPIPFVSSAIDIAIILEEVIFYRKQLGLDDCSLTHLASLTNISLQKLKENVKLKTSERLFTVGGLTEYMKQYAAHKVAEKIAHYTLPGIGIAIACGISFTCTTAVLHAILEMITKDAINVLVYVTTKETAI